MNNNGISSAKDKIAQATSLAGKFNDADKMQYYPIESLVSAMETFNDPAVANNPQVQEALSKLQAVINTRLAKIAEGKEPLSADDLSVINQFIGYGSDTKVKSQAQKKLQEVIDEYEEENGLNQDEEVLRRNDASLNKHLSEMNLYEENGLFSYQFSDLGKIINRVDVVEQSQNNRVLSEKQKSENISMLFEAAKLEAYRKNVGSIKYLMSTQAEQRKMLADTTQDIFMSKLGQVVLSSEITPPTAEELQDEDKLQAYVERSEKEAQLKLQRLVDSDKRIFAKTDNIIASCADTESKASFFLRHLEERIGKGASKLSQKLEKFNAKAKKLWGKRYDVAQALSNNIKDNNIRLIADTAVTLGVGAIVANAGAPVVATAFVANAAYTAVGSYWYPFLSEAKKIQRVAKEKGQTIKFAQAWKMARAKLKNDENHKRNARWGVLGGALFGAIGVGSMGAGLNSVASRGFALLGRMGGSTSSQIHNFVIAKRDYKK